MSLDVPTVLAPVACVLLVVQIAWMWRISRLARALERYEARLSQLGDAMGLLTEAAESGFRTMATELERLAEAPRPGPPRPAAAARMAAAARRGRSHAEIAAAEDVSEGEVALRLHLTGQGRERIAEPRRRPRATKETPDGTVRAK